MKVNRQNLRERVVDALIDSVDSKAVRFVSKNTRPICLGLTLVMAAFYFGFVARSHDTGATVVGIGFGVAHIAAAVLCCWLMYRESHPRASMRSSGAGR